MANIAVQLGIRVAPWVVDAVAAGATALGVGAAVEALSGTVEIDKAWLNTSATVSCWRCDDQRCKYLRDKINGNNDELLKRGDDLREDKLGLPYRAVGDVAKPSLSIWGHEQLYKQHQSQLREALQEYIARQCGPVRADTWTRATQNVPRKEG